jgi:hypothetical protein
VAAQSKAWTVFANSNTGVVGSNPTRGMDVSVCVYSVFVLSCLQVAALRRADPPSKESYRLFIGLRNWKIGQGPKGCRAIEEKIREICSNGVVTAYYNAKSHAQETRKTWVWVTTAWPRFEPQHRLNSQYDEDLPSG